MRSWRRWPGSCTSARLGSARRSGRCSRRAGSALGRPPDTFRDTIPSRRLSTLWRLHGRVAWARGDQSRAIAHHGRILPAAGGIVIVDGIAILGAIGVAGAHHPDQDILCAQAALAVLEGAHH